MSRDQHDPTFQASPAEAAAMAAPAAAPDQQSTSSSSGVQTATAVAAEAPPMAPPQVEQEAVATEAEPTSLAQPSAQTVEQSIAQPAGGEAETSEGMEQLIEQYATPPATPAEGEIFDGRVIAVNDAGVVVDVGGKFEGLVPAQEFLDAGGAITFGPGQTIEVERLHE
ncbi:MAG: S1 RNA-binding domain-containing protein, partial [Candidatus Acidiferrales bacterium]